jgi:Raf kinase inhibitor-like YbhB/YbcL family protein
MKLDLTSTVFEDGTAIPAQYTGDGEDTSPPLRWSDPPAQTRTFALICDDPDAPRGTWVHWVLFNLPANSRELREGVPTAETLDNGAKQGKNDLGRSAMAVRRHPKAKRIAISSRSTPWISSWICRPVQPRSNFSPQ